MIFPESDAFNPHGFDSVIGSLMIVSIVHLFVMFSDKIE